MKNILAFFILLCLCNNYVFAQDYSTSVSGLLTNDSNWDSSNNPLDLEGNNTNNDILYQNNYSGPDLVIEISHDMTFTGNMLFKSNKPDHLIIRIVSGGRLFIDGNLNSETANIIVEEGGKLDVSGSFTTNNSGGVSANDIIIDGDVTIGNGVNNISGGWVVSSTGSLNITGEFDTNSETNFNIDGYVYVDGNVILNAGTWDIGSTGTFKTTATTLNIGGSHIDNNGKFIANKVTSVTKGGGNDFDCNGSGGTGQVNFGNLAGACSLCSEGATQNDATKTGCYDGDAPLPVVLTYFTAELQDNEFQFAWQTAAEENNDYFTIEYSEDILSFSQLDNIDGAGDSKSIIDYEYSTPSFPFEEVIYFRLKQTDFNGAYAYSKIVPVTKNATEMDLSLYPNPAKTSTLLTLNIDNEEPIAAQLVNSVTLNVISNFSITDGQALIDVSSLENGVYYITVTGHTSPFRLLIQH